jgi:hypothetical protein
MDEKKARKPRVVKMKPLPQERQMKAQVVPRSGHTLYEVDKTEMTMKPAEYQIVKKMVEVAPIMNKILRTKGTPEFVEKEVKEVIIKPNCLYISALNPKNVMKILVRNFGFIPEEPLNKNNHGIVKNKTL